MEALIVFMTCLLSVRSFVQLSLVNHYTPWIDHPLTEPNAYQQLPTVIAGDLDSIRPEVREYYEHHSVPIREDVSQDATDLKKCFDWVREVGIPQLQATTDVAVKVSILIFGSLAGRVDQAFSLLHHLVLTENQLLPYMGDGRIYLVGSESITFLLSNRRKNRIFLMGRRPQRTCGILPAGAPAVISTKGLNWDVIDWTTSIGTRVSTSNWIVDESVEVTCSEQVFFTVQVCKA